MSPITWFLLCIMWPLLHHMISVLYDMIYSVTWHHMIPLYCSMQLQCGRHCKWESVVQSYLRAVWLQAQCGPARLQWLPPRVLQPAWRGRLPHMWVFLFPKVLNVGTALERAGFLLTIPFPRSQDSPDWAGFYILALYVLLFIYICFFFTCTSQS